MPNKKPLNELERVVARAMKSKSAMPDFYRQILISPLWYLLPYHPEMEGEMQLNAGDPVNFTAWSGPDGQFVPIFSDMKRVDECLKAVSRQDKNTCVGKMEGKLLLHILGLANIQTILNPACNTGELRMLPHFMLALVDGSLLNTSAAPKSGIKFIILDPADYPTDLIQPLFEFMRKHDNFKAGWLFLNPEPHETPKPGFHYYTFLVLMEPEHMQLAKDLAAVMKSLYLPNIHCAMTALGADNPNTNEIIQNLQPFYTAPDFPQIKERI